MSYHEPDRSRLRLREEFGKDLDGVRSVVSSIMVSASLIEDSGHTRSPD